MKLQREPQSESLVEEVLDITDKYPKRDGVLMVTEIFTNRNFDFRQYLKDLEELGIPEESVGLSFCG